MNFTRNLLSWYHDNKRDLPWRHTKDPYLVWLSEIIMQQTRIDQGTPYYLKFAMAYPTVRHLAEADEHDVLKLWQGLGYYSRARNLHETARMIVKMHGGTFPDTYSAIRMLKGVGDYTAAAIASICFGLPYAVVDGNVMRLLARVFGIQESIDLPGTKKKIQTMATEYIDHLNPGDFNQAMMEFGATVCVPSVPGCIDCIFKTRCVALNTGAVDTIPVRNIKSALRDRYVHYLVLTITHQGEEFIFLNKRTGNGIWKNLYDFPCVEHSGGKADHVLQEQEFDSMVNSEGPHFIGVSSEYIHLLTHLRLHVWFYRFHAEKRIELPYFLVPLKELSNYPVPKLIDRYLLENDILQ